jgi:hypothetical protein
MPVVDQADGLSGDDLPFFTVSSCALGSSSSRIKQARGRPVSETHAIPPTFSDFLSSFPDKLVLDRPCAFALGHRETPAVDETARSRGSWG